MSFQLNQRVKARWQGGSYFNGKISAINDDGTYGILFDDGDVENNEPAADIIGIALKVFTVGQAVKARWQGGSYFFGKISSVNDDGTFGVLFNDGESDPSEPGEDIEPLGVAGKFLPGDKVNARWQGGSFYPGSVTADNGDGTYAVLFEDGCTDNAEPGSDIFPENAELPVEKALAGKIFVAQYESQANLKVYVTYSESLADLCVHKQDYESHADGNSGLWWFADYSQHAEKVIWFTEYESLADLKIYYVSSSSLGGWRNNDKKHLMEI